MGAGKYLGLLKGQINPADSSTVEDYVFKLIVSLIATGSSPEFTQLLNLATADGDDSAVAYFSTLLSQGAAIHSSSGSAGPAGPMGPAGPTGPQGPTGANGTRGSLITSGAGAPSGSANNLDVYLNTLTDDIYQYNGTSWGSPIVNLLGSQIYAAAGIPSTSGTFTWNASSATGVSISGAQVSHSSNHTRWDGDVISNETIGNGGDASYTVSATGLDLILGLTNTIQLPNESQTAPALPYAFYLSSPNVLHIFDSSGTIYSGNYAANDVLKISISGNIVSFYQNATLRATSAVAPTLPLYYQVAFYTKILSVAQISFNSQRAGKTNDLYVNSSNGDLYQYESGSWGSPIANIKGANGSNGANGTNGSNGSNGANGSVWYTGAYDPTAGSYEVNWTHLVKAVVSGSAVTKSEAVDAWDSYALSDQITNSINYINTAQSPICLLGLSKSANGSIDPANVENFVDYAWYITAPGQCTTFEVGIGGENNFSYNAGDVLGLSVSGNFVNFTINGVVQQTGTVAVGGAPLRPMIGIYSSSITANSDASIPNTLAPNANDLYLRTSTGDVYQYESGAWGSPIENLKGPAGPNATTGTATLNGTTAVTIADAAITANSRIFLTIQVPGGTVGSPYVDSRVAGTSFNIKSTAAGDTSTFAWMIIEP